MSMDPQGCTVATHQGLQIAGEGRGQQVTGIPWGHRLRRGCMVGDHHRLAVEGLCQRCRQPVPAGHMQPDGILGREIPAAIPDNGKVRHTLLRLLHGEERVRFAQKGKVRPQDAAQKPYPVNDHLVIVQDVYVLRCPGLQIIDQGDVMAVEFVVARHVDHGPMREPLFRPVQASRPYPDIACQHHDVGIRCRRLEILELNVKIIQDVDFHFATLYPETQIMMPFAYASRSSQTAWLTSSVPHETGIKNRKRLSS